MNWPGLEVLGNAASLLLLDAAVKGGIWLALVMLAERCCARGHGAWRRLLWRMSVAGLLLIPFAPAVLPGLNVAVLPARGAQIEPEAGGAACVSTGYGR